MQTLFIFSPLSQFEVTSLIGLNAPILGHVSLTLTNLDLFSSLSNILVSIPSFDYMLLITEIFKLCIIAIGLTISSLIFASRGQIISENVTKGLSAAGGIAKMYLVLGDGVNNNNNDKDKNTHNNGSCNKTTNNNSPGNEGANSSSNSSNNTNNDTNSSNSSNTTNNGANCSNSSKSSNTTNNGANSSNSSNNSNTTNKGANCVIPLIVVKIAVVINLLVQIMKNSNGLILRLIKWILNCKLIVFLKNFDLKQWEHSNSLFKQSFLFTIILEKLNINEKLFSDSLAQSGAEPSLYLFSLGVFILSLISLFSLVNLLGYFISIYLVHKFDLKNRYPKYTKLIAYFENSSLVFVIIEILFCFICLTVIVVSSFLMFIRL